MQTQPRTSSDPGPTRVTEVPPKYMTPKYTLPGGGKMTCKDCLNRFGESSKKGNDQLEKHLHQAQDSKLDIRFVILQSPREDRVNSAKMLSLDNTVKVGPTGPGFDTEEGQSISHGPLCFQHITRVPGSY
jgi:hypothetical protein